MVYWWLFYWPGQVGAIPNHYCHLSLTHVSPVSAIAPGTITMVNKVRSRERILDNYTSIQWCCRYATCLRSSKCCCCFALWHPLLLLLRMPYQPLNKTVTFIKSAQIGSTLDAPHLLVFLLVHLHTVRSHAPLLQHEKDCQWLVAQLYTMGMHCLLYLLCLSCCLWERSNVLAKANLLHVCLIVDRTII